MSYAFAIRLSGEIDEIEEKVIAALKQEGFGVLTHIDVQQTLKEKLGLEEKPYRILGACNPPLAHQALEAEPDIGLLLPCNVVVRSEDDGGVTVSFMDPEAVLTLVERNDVAALAQQVKKKLEQVRDALIGRD
ncbi:MAG: DUF302 domain-containing protein [Thiotrichales bacterium]